MRKDVHQLDEKKDEEEGKEDVQFIPISEWDLLMMINEKLDLLLEQAGINLE